MSVRVNRDYSRSKFATAEKQVKKFCGVCQKAGLSEKDYTSHFTKSAPGPQGTVICPTILNNECSFCFEFGHFKSACPALAERKKQQKRSEMQEKRVQFKEQPVQKQISSNRGGFSVLDDSDDETPVGLKRTFSQADLHKEVKKVTKVASKDASKVEEWPSLCSKPVIKSSVTADKPSFATVISAPAPIKKVDTSRASICGFSVLTKAGIVPAASSEDLAKKVYKPMTKCSWADMDSDSEGDDEDW